MNLVIGITNFVGRLAGTFSDMTSIIMVRMCLTSKYLETTYLSGAGAGAGVWRSTCADLIGQLLQAERNSCLVWYL